jgi:MoaA/NifB/PqqE/SkfB family radical SAM enzyme
MIKNLAELFSSSLPRRWIVYACVAVGLVIYAKLRGLNPAISSSGALIELSFVALFLLFLAASFLSRNRQERLKSGFFQNVRICRAWKTFSRVLRELRMVVYGALSKHHPIMAHVIPIRRCHLACGYCNEYDDYSKPVAAAVMISRIDRLADLGTSILTLSGGEPLLHPELDEIIYAIRSRGMIAGITTSGYLLTKERVQRLNLAGLDHLQITIDNVMPDRVSKKSLKVLDKKLQILAEHAVFHVNVNSVVGGGLFDPGDALVVGRRARELGFSVSVGIIRTGGSQGLSDSERAVYQEMKGLETHSFTRFNSFQESIGQNLPSVWRCRAGSRYLYVCEDGLVHYCSEQRGYPAKPLDLYTSEDIRREYLTEKPCAPFCTVDCVHYISYFDSFRAPQTTQSGLKGVKVPDLVKIQPARHQR